MKTNPHAVGRESNRAFWADAVADEVETRVKGGQVSEPIVVKGGISPSGVPHLGNVNEIMRGNYVAEVLRNRGYEVRQVFTTDDRDPLRKLPRKLADLDGNIVDLGDVDAGALGRNLGKPYTKIDDPFDCDCGSYGEHFSELIDKSAELLGVDIEIVSNTEYYKRGKFDHVIEHVLHNVDEARDVLAAYQNKVDDDYVPFNPICRECKRITETVTAIHPDEGTVEYRCTGIEAGDKFIEGCGHEGTAKFREGKLPWRFEWPAQWKVLGVDFEPFGKDHAEGSWRSGEDIAEFLNVQPPVPMVYEWFTLNGKPFSSSQGNVVLVQDVLQLLERDVVRYFFAKDPWRSRDFDIGRLDQLVTEFDAFEATYFDEEAADVEIQERVPEEAYPYVVAPTSFENDDRQYRHCVAKTDVSDVINYKRKVAVDETHLERNTRFHFDGAVNSPMVFRRLSEDIPPEALVDEQRPREPSVVPEALYDMRDLLVDNLFRKRIRIPYTFAAVLGMFDDPDLREQVARKEGHVTDVTPEWAVETALGRVDLAAEWAQRTDNEFNYELKRAEIPDVHFDSETETALDELADFVAAGHDGDEIQGEIYETAKRHDLDISDFFSAGYRLLFDEDQGPQLGPFIAKLDRDFVVQRLRRER